jgi:hypothetical protein
VHPFTRVIFLGQNKKGEEKRKEEIFLGKKRLTKRNGCIVSISR